MKCKYCGEELLQDAVFCSACGRRVDGDSIPEEVTDNNILPAQEQEQETTESVVQDKKPKSKKGLFIGIAIAIVVILCVLVLPKEIKYRDILSRYERFGELTWTEELDLFTDITELSESKYRDSEKLYILIRSRIMFTTNDEATVEVVKQLVDIIDYRDARDALVDNVASVFLRGEWNTVSGTSYFLSMKYDSETENSSCASSLPKPNVKGTYNIEDGIYIIYDSTDNTIQTKCYKFTVIDKDTIDVYCYKDGQTYRMVRE